MNKKDIIIIALLVATIGAVAFRYFKPIERTAFLDINKVFSEFEMKKELEIQLTKVKQTRQHIIDSLEFDLKLIAKKIQAENQTNKDRIAKFELMRDDYLEKKEIFEKDNMSITKKYDAQIIEQLNQYVKDFGSKQGYTYIFGADGSGFLMYSSENKNITEEVKAYINDRYKGNTE